MKHNPLVLLSLFVAPMCVMAQGQPSILNVRENVSVSSSSVFLADLLEVSDQLPRELRESVVLTAPTSGQRHRISLVDIAYKLQRFPALLNYHLRGPDFVVIQRTHGEEELKHIKRRIEEHIRNTEPWASWEIEINFSLVDEINLNEIGPFDHLALQSLDRVTMLGQVELRLTFFDQQGVAISEGNIAPYIRRQLNAVMLDDAREQGHLLSTEDLRIAQVWVGDENVRLISDVKDCIGRELTRRLAGGEMLQDGHLTEPVCARRGDDIWVTCKIGGMQVLMTGMAVERGRRGDTVRVRNPASQKEILVDLTAPKKAQIQFHL